MDYNILGKTGIKVSKLCFGALTIGPLQANLPLDDGARVISEAIDRGVNFIDTAQLYKTYPYIKKALSQRSIKNVVIASKSYAYSKKTAEESLYEALREIDRDYIDIFLLHEQENEYTLKGHYEALEYFIKMKEKGIIRGAQDSQRHSLRTKLILLLTSDCARIRTQTQQARLLQTAPTSSRQHYLD